MVTRLKADFTTLTLVLIPVAIVVNIVIGHTVQVILHLPIYLDSIGTILVALLAGPLAGALTGVLSNVIWYFLFDPTILGFAITACIIGLVSGLFGQLGWFRKELDKTLGLVLIAIVGGVLILLQVANALFISQSLSASLIGGGLAVILTALALFLAARQTLPALVVVGGVLTGIISAIVSAPIATYIYGGLTGGGTDALVALFQQAGLSILQSNLEQGLVSDPLDKFMSFIIVWSILRGLSQRYLARFPRASNVLKPAHQFPPAEEPIHVSQPAPEQMAERGATKDE